MHCKNVFCQLWSLYDLHFYAESVVDVYGADGKGGGLGGEGTEEEEFVSIFMTRSAVHIPLHLYVLPIE